MNNITVFGSPDEMVRTVTEKGKIVDSGYGKVNYRAWCELERNRMNANRDNVTITTRADGFIALAR
jgi:hypothetical protein